MAVGTGLSMALTRGLNIKTGGLAAQAFKRAGTPTAGGGLAGLGPTLLGAALDMRRRRRQRIRDEQSNLSGGAPTSSFLGG